MLDARRRQPKALRISTDVPPLTRYSSDLSSCSPSPTTRSVTPATTPNTGDPWFFFHVLCMHDFKSSDPDHLSFHEDEVLTIVKQEHSGWWAAMRSDKDQVGWIPSSFVRPLDRSRIVQPDEEPCPYDSSTDHPLSAVCDSWVPVCDDCKFQLVTPTDLVPYDFFDDRPRDYNCNSFMNMSGAEQFSDMGDIRVPSTPESPLALPHCPQWPLLSELEVSQFIRSASPKLLHTVLRDRSRPYDAPFPFLSTSDTPDESPSELISGSGSEVRESAPTSQDTSHSARHDQRTSNVRPLDPTIWDSDNLAEQLYVLMHTSYATTRKDDCLDWTFSQKSAEVTGLRRFLDTRNHISSLARQSAPADADTARQADLLDFWIRVAETYQTLGNVYSLCAITLALSGSVALSSHGSTWARCTYEQTFATLRNLVGASNEFHRLVDAVDAVKGPSIPFVRNHSDRIKELLVGRCDTSSFAANADSSAAPHDMLCRQSSPYAFEIERAIQ